MSEDAKLTILTGALLASMRDQVDHLIAKGLVDKDQLRVTLAPAAIKAAASELMEKEGLSQRQIAKRIGVSRCAVQRAVGSTDPTHRGRSGSTKPVSPPSRRIDRVTYEAADTTKKTARAVAYSHDSIADRYISEQTKRLGPIEPVPKISKELETTLRSKKASLTIWTRQLQGSGVPAVVEALASALEVIDRHLIP